MAAAAVVKSLLTVDASGKVTSAEDAGSDSIDKATIACVLASMKSAPLPANPNGPTTVIVPIDVRSN